MPSAWQSRATAQTSARATAALSGRPSTEGTNASVAARAIDTSSNSPIHSTLAWPRSPARIWPTLGAAVSRVGYDGYMSVNFTGSASPPAIHVRHEVDDAETSLRPERAECQPRYAA